MAEIAQAPQTELRPVLRREKLLELSRRLSEPFPLRAARQAGYERYQSADLPDRVQHLWRYTDPLELFPWQEATALSLTAQGPLSTEPAQATRVLLEKGAPLFVELGEEARDKGVLIAPLSAPDAGEEIFFGRAVSPDHGLFEALNAAAWTFGVALRLPPHTLLSEPIEVVVRAGAEAVTIPRLLFVVGEGCEATLIERHQGGARGGLVVGVSELFVGERSNIRYVFDQGLAPEATAHLTQRSIVERSAKVLTVLTSFGGKQIKMDLGAVLRGEGAQSELIGIALGDRRQQLDHHTEHRHIARDTLSNMDVKVALVDRARSSYTGLIRIEEHAAGSEAYQEERNLLLSQGARANAIPELEILNNEVRCTHGSTTSQIDEEQLFYLLSRGIEAHDAERLVVRGFFEGALSKLPETLRQDLEATLEERLSRVFGRGGTR